MAVVNRKNKVNAPKMTDKAMYLPITAEQAGSVSSRFLLGESETKRYADAVALNPVILEPDLHACTWPIHNTTTATFLCSNAKVAR